MQEEQKNEPTKEKNLKRKIFSWIVSLSLALIVGLAISHVVKPTVVSGISMYPTFEDGDYLLMNCLSEPEQGDIVVFNTKFDEVFIKRVIGVAGDTVKVKDGKVWINGEQIKEEYINGDFELGDVEVTVPENKLFVMGDNRDNSLDSRAESVGLVDVEDVIGVVFIDLFPSIAIPK